MMKPLLSFRRRVIAGVVVWFGLAAAGCAPQQHPLERFAADNPAFREAAENAQSAREAFSRSHRFVVDWLAYADPETGLIPRNLHGSIDLWEPKDSAADNYPFMVLTAALTDRPLFEGRMLEILQTEKRLTSRLGRLPDTYSFSKRGFLRDEVDQDEIIFGAAEYVKDGLLPLTEWLGQSPWSDRMMGIIDDLWDLAPFETPYGSIVSDNVEVNGEMLQTLSRVYWMTGDGKYLEYAIRLGDYYLLGDRHPTRHLDRLRLRDHGCEIISGLTELYATLYYLQSDKKQEYQQPIHEMLDRVLEIGRNEHGLFYNVVNPISGAILDEGIADTFGYTLNGFYTVYEIDGTARYREAVLKAMRSLSPHYRDFDWEQGSADGYADAIEGAINLLNREPDPSVAAWIESEMRVMWDMQDYNPRRGEEWRGSGIIEGWHGDGNFARTSLMYALWKTQGLSADPWREDLQFGAVDREGALLVHLTAEEEWQGRLVFDRPRHSTILRLPHDWPRINQFPEWFTVEGDREYVIHDVRSAAHTVYDGHRLQDGIELHLNAGEEMLLVIQASGAVE